ncbi:MAG: C25 family cysteine peptidase [candidate division WOR-3 bacterium]
MLMYLLVGAVFSTRLSFEPRDISVSNEGYGERFRLEGCSFDLIPGMPLMPLKPVIVALPSGAKNLRLSFSAGGRVRVAENVNLERFQISRGINKELGTPEAPEPAITSNYPAQRARLARFGYMRGQALAVIQVFPLELTPQGELYLYRYIELTLEYDMGGDHPSGPGLDPYFYNVLKATVVNPEALMSPSWNSTNLDYAIITRDRFLPVLDSFVLHRKLSGYRVEVFTLDWFSSNFQGKDLPEKLRAGIKWLWENRGVRFVLLVGAHEDIPPKMCWVPCYDPYYGDSVDTDYYYACLDGDWNKNGDWFYGTVWDSVDLFPEVFVGRLAVRDTGELRAFLAKCFSYDLNPSPNAGRYMIHVADIWETDDSKRYANALRQYIPDSVEAYEISFVEAENPTQTTQEFMDSIEIVGPGFLISMCHGNMNGVQVNRRTNQRLRPYHIRNLTNSPFFLICIGCYYNNIHTRSIGKDFMLQPGGGALGVLGSVKEDYPEISWFSLFSEIVSNFYGGNMETEGQIDALSRMVLAGSAQGNSAILRTLLAYRLHGDPGGVLINWRVDSLSVTPDPLITDTFRVYVSTRGSPCPGARVVLYRDSVVWLMEETGPDGYARFRDFPVRVGDYTVSVSKRNYIPWRGTVPAPNTGVQVSLSEIWVDDDDHDGIAHPAETLRIRAKIRNFGSAAGNNVAIKAVGMDPDIFFIKDSVYIGILGPGAERMCTLRVRVAARPRQTYEHALYSINIYRGGSLGERDSLYLPVKSGRPKITGVRSSFSGDTVRFSVEIVNEGLYDLRNLKMMVSSADGSSVLFDSTYTISLIPPGKNSSHAHTFGARLVFPISEPRFSLRLDDNAGPWDTFNLRLRPGPTIPSGFASPTPNGVSVYWGRAHRAFGYKVFRGADIAYPGVISATTFSDEPLNYTQIYTYSVVAVDSFLNEGEAIGPFAQRPNPPHGPHPPVNATMAFRLPPVICNMDPSYPGLEAVFNSNFYMPPYGDPAVLHIVHADGTQPPGFPLEMRVLNGQVLQAIGDIDGDSLLEYVTGDIWNDTLFAFNADGSLVPGWPVYMGGDIIHVPTPVFMQDFDADGLPEIGLWGTVGTLWILDGNGTVILQKALGGPWQRNLPATADIDDDKVPEIAVMTGDSRLYLLRPDGTVLPGFPVTVDSLSSDLGGVAIGELVKTSPGLEIVTLTSKGTLTVVLATGAIYSQINPYYSGADCVQQGPILADFTGDGNLEIAYVGSKSAGYSDTTARDSCWIVSPEGELLSPPLLKTRGRGDGGSYATAGDIDGDGAAELIVPTRYGTIFAFNSDGTMVLGFPIVIQHDGSAGIEILPALYGGVAIADQNLDGFADLHAVTFQGVYHAWETFVPYSKKGWLSWGHDRWNTRAYAFWPSDGPGVEEVSGSDLSFFLAPPIPNPSRGKVSLQFGIPTPAEVTLALYDVAGRRTDMLFSGKLEPGVYRIDKEITRPSGVYFLRLTAGSRTAVRKTVIAR